MGGQTTLALLVAVTLVVAVSAVAVSFDDTPEPMMGGGSASDSPATTPPTATPSPTADASATTLSVTSTNPASANLSTDKRAVIARVVSNFTEKLPDNETARRTTTLTVAERLCTRDQEFERRIDTTQLKHGGTQAKAAARRMEFGAQIINEQFTDEVPARKFTKIRSGVETATKYTPIVGSYNRMANASCRAAEYRNETALKRFYWSAMMFGVDVALIQANAFYGPAFRSTGFATNQARKIGLWRLRRLCGNRCLALGMSEVHFAARAGLYGAIDKTLYDLGELGIERDEVDWLWIAEQQGWDPSQLPRNFPRRAEIVDSADSAVACSDVADDAANVSKDIAVQVGNITGVDTRSVTNDPTNETVDCEE